MKTSKCYLRKTNDMLKIMICTAGIFLFSTFNYLTLAQADKNVAPIVIKAVVVTMFEKGEATGDDAGELQRWVESEDIQETFDFPMGEFPLILDFR